MGKTVDPVGVSTNLQYSKDTLKNIDGITT